ncbi:hypothetical protein N7486_006888 [Penicillium sp. IBT 16267x]|nr:hypothetical protein N7486_006888 [Penicillium sp. IBT 16267x]
MHLITMFLALAPVLAVPFNEPGTTGGFPSGNGGFPDGNRGPVCSSGLLYSQAQCCKTDVLNLADLDCKPASRSYNGHDDFKAACLAEGRSAKCCSVPILKIVPIQLY